MFGTYSARIYTLTHQRLTERRATRTAYGIPHLPHPTPSCTHPSPFHLHSCTPTGTPNPQPPPHPSRVLERHSLASFPTPHKHAVHPWVHRCLSCVLTTTRSPPCVYICGVVASSTASAQPGSIHALELVERAAGAPGCTADRRRPSPQQIVRKTKARRARDGRQIRAPPAHIAAQHQRKKNVFR